MPINNAIFHDGAKNLNLWNWIRC